MDGDAEDYLTEHDARLAAEQDAAERRRRWPTTADPAWQAHAAEHWERRYREQHRTLHDMEDELARVRAERDDWKRQAQRVKEAEAADLAIRRELTTRGQLRTEIIQLRARRDRLIETGEAMTHVLIVTPDHPVVRAWDAAVADARKDRT